MKRLFFILMMVILCQGSAIAQSGLDAKQKAIKIHPKVGVLAVGTLSDDVVTMVEGTIDVKQYVVVQVSDWEVLNALDRMNLPEGLSKQEDLGVYLMTKLGLDVVVLVCGRSEEIYAVWIEQSCSNGICTIITYPYNWRGN